MKLAKGKRNESGQRSNRGEKNSADSDYQQNPDGSICTFSDSIGKSRNSPK